jgi:HSP20 family protein
MPKQSEKQMPEATKGKEVQRAESPRMLSPFEEMDRWFENAFPRGWMRPFQWGEWPMWGELARPFEARIPRVDVIDRDEEVMLRAELPGIEKKDLDISVTDNAVSIKATSVLRKKKKKEIIIAARYHVEAFPVPSLCQAMWKLKKRRHHLRRESWS